MADIQANPLQVVQFAQLPILVAISEIAQVAEITRRGCYFSNCTTWGSSVCQNPQNKVYSMSNCNLQNVKLHGGKVLAIPQLSNGIWHAYIRAI